MQALRLLWYEKERSAAKLTETLHNKVRLAAFQRNFIKFLIVH